MKLQLHHPRWESQYLTTVWHQPLLTRWVRGQVLGRVLEAPELCQKLTLWLLGLGEVGEGEEQGVGSEGFQYFHMMSSTASWSVYSSLCLVSRYKWRVNASLELTGEGADLSGSGRTQTWVTVSQAPHDSLRGSGGRCPTRACGTEDG